ncbi:MAG: NAD(P)/FAD-dependent oxidoreductase [Gammaproteobacteria bacterium]|nr:NAD(P)/FAD-dependent oxidoreductase [Gammaproteobacteria bacterium]
MTIPDLSDTQLRDALACAHIPSLMVSLVHLTGDLALIRGDIRPQHGFMLGPDCGISEAHQQHIRDLAFDTIRAFQSRHGQLADLGEDAIVEMCEFIIAAPLEGPYGELLQRELVIGGTETFAHDSFAGIPHEARASFRVLVVGAGMSGLLAAKRLKDEGIDFVVIDKNAGVGGTWLENTYPGCRVDSANHMYSYSFEPYDWPQHFSDNHVLLAYFERFADKYGLREHLVLDTEVSSAVFDEDTGTWRLETENSRGEVVKFEGNALIMATGQLNRPRLPDISGRDSFSGIAFHSARWAHAQDLTDRRIGVIGTGASAFQFVPEISKIASSVTVFQRTPPWILPTPEYHDSIPEGKHWLLNHLPFYGKWYRFWVFHSAGEGLLDSVRRDPGWHNARSISAKNEEVTQLLEAFVREQLAGRPDLINACIPAYPLGAKRGLRDNGAWLQSLCRDNVQLVTSKIDAIHERGVRTRNGQNFEFDVLIYGTGFKASDFFFPMQIRGRGGKTLEEHWQGDPRAYLGIAIPDFPNLFVLYGPNTNIVINASITFFSECEVRYVMGCIRLLLAEGRSVMDCKKDVHDAYNEWIDRGNEQMAWGTPGVSTWYKNAAGRVTQNWPYSMLEFWQQTKSPNAADYQLS